MPPTVRRLVGQASLGLRLVGEGDSADDPLNWVYSSDLADPTPFLTAGQLLLTTGTQFQVDAAQGDYDVYVRRLRESGVRGLGFGTEVISSGTPDELVSACAEQGMPLLEVPYRTPFIAVIRWAADLLATEARARDDWSLHTQRAISLAALGSGGITAVLAELATQLECQVALFDTNGALSSAHPQGNLSEEQRTLLEAEATRLLRRGQRAGAAISVGDERATLQTLGRGPQLRGVLVVLGGNELDGASQAVVTSAVALAEMSLEQGTVLRQRTRALREQLLSLLLSGQIDAVRRALDTTGEGLPDEPVLVVVRAIDDEQDADAAFERIGAFVATELTLVSAARRSALMKLLSERSAFAGISSPVGYDELSAGLAGARRALTRASRDGTKVVEASDEVLGLFSRPEIAEIAASRLSELLADEDGRMLLRCATVWLEHNGAWDPAARELGLHRHSLRARITRLEQSLALNLERFGDRAQLWALLEAVDL